MAARRVLIAAVLLGLVLLSATSVEGRRPRRRHGDAMDLSPEEREMLEAVKPALEACKEQAQALCPPRRPRGDDDHHDEHDEHDRRRLDHSEDGERDGEGDGERRERRPNPLHVALCLDDHAEELTGECATAWAAVEAEVREAAYDMAAERLTPLAQFRRECHVDVKAACNRTGVREDVVGCLLDLEDAGQLSDDCGEFLGDDAAGMLDDLAVELAHGGDYDDAEAAGGAPTFTVAQFDDIDDMEFEEDDEEHHGPPILAIAGVAVVAAAVIALVVAGVLFVKRRRAARSQRQHRLSGLHHATSGAKGMQRVNSMSSEDSGVTLVHVKPTDTPPATTSEVQLV